MRLQKRKGTVDGYEWRCRNQSKDNRPTSFGVGSLVVKVGTLCEAARLFIVLRSSEGFLSPSSSPVNSFRISCWDDSPVRWIS
ncbi:hypothetical protein TNCV_1018601 [Trichonephila clavipes]|nr:hypothetical protein TNCV_1018601 [Trichonephila clavipes]